MARALLGPPRSASLGSTTPIARFPNHVQRAAPNSCSPEALPGLLSTQAGSLTRDIQRPSPCTSCTGVGLLAGFSPPLILAPRLLQDGRAGPTRESGPRSSATPTPPFPATMAGPDARSPASTTPDPGRRLLCRSGNLHLEGEVESGAHASPAAVMQWTRPALPAQATLSRAAAAGAPGRLGTEARTGSTRGGREKPPHLRQGEGRAT